MTVSGPDPSGLSTEDYLANVPTLRQAEELLIHRALEQAKGNQGIAALLLGVSRQALNKRLVREKKEKS